MLDETLRNLEQEIRAIAREEAKRAVAEAKSDLAAQELVSAATAAKLVDVTPGTIRAWARAGLLTRHGKGRRMRVDPREVRELVRRPRSQRKPDASATVADEVARILGRKG
jgi:hypothetical protein